MGPPFQSVVRISVIRNLEAILGASGGLHFLTNSVVALPSLRSGPAGISVEFLAISCDSKFGGHLKERREKFYNPGSVRFAHVS